jgi:hypothetical protein
VLGRAVEVPYILKADSFRSLNEGTHRRSVFFVRALANGKRAGAAVPGVIAGRRVLDRLVFGENFPHDHPSIPRLAQRAKSAGLARKATVPFTAELPPITRPRGRAMSCPRRAASSLW